MAAWATIDGQRVTSGTLVIPTYGMWAADLVLPESYTVPASSTLVVGDLTLIGAVVRSAPFAGNLTVRVVGGFGGWGRNLTPRAYQNPAGVSLATILGDAAIELGERVNVGTDRLVGTAFVREAMPGQRLLKQLCDRQWYVDTDGTTRIGTRATGAIASEFTVVTHVGGTGRFTIATEVLADWMPGRSFSAPTVATTQRISMVRHTFGDKGVARSEVLTEKDLTSDARDRQWFRELVRAEFPQLTFLGLHEYIVQAVNGTTTVDAVPLDQSKLPGIVKAPLHPSILGEQVTPVVGSRCLVAFIGADPTKPIVMAGDPANPPTLAKLGGGTRNVARVDDTTNDGTLALTSAPVGPNTVVSLTYTPPGGAPQIATITVPAGSAAGTLNLAGKITSGASNVKA